MPESSQRFCFLDANVLIHFETFDEVDWPSKIGAISAELVLAPSVMRELDRYKDDYSNERRRKRVRTILPKLKSILDKADDSGIGFVRQNTTLSTIDFEPRLDWSGLHLDPAVADDRLIASIVGFQRDKSDVVLVTNDFPLQRKAKRHDIRVVEPEGLIDRIEHAAPDEARVRELEKELSALKTRVPELAIGFWESNKLTAFIGRPEGTWAKKRVTDAMIATHVEGLRQGFERELGSRTGHYAEKFKREFEHYLINLRVHLERGRTFESDVRYEVTFVIENRGHAHAEDVEIFIDFPTDVFAVGIEDEKSDHDGFGEMEYLLRTPVPYWKIKHDYGYILSSTPGYDPWSISYPEFHEKSLTPAGPFYYNDRSRVSFQHPKLRPHDRWIMPSIAVFVPAMTQRGFQVGCRVVADELSKPIETKLHFQFSSSLE